MVLGGVLCLLAVAVMGLLRVRFDADVLRLVPSSSPPLRAFHTFINTFGTLDDLYIVFSAPEGASVSDYDEIIDGWLQVLRAAPEILRVDSGRPDASRDWSWLADRELLLLDDERLTTALGRMKPEAMPAALASTRELLAVPSPDIAALVQDDPLGLHDLLRQQLSVSGTPSPFGGENTGYLSRDGRQRLVIARPAAPPYDTDFARALLSRLEEIRRQQAASVASTGSDALPPLDVEFAGGHRIALEAERVVRRESVTNGVGSLALILPLLFVVFRSVSLMLIGALPSAVALLMVLGGAGIAGVPLSAAATGAASMLFGLGVDGVVLLYVAHRNAVARGLGPEDAAATLATPAASMLLGMWTTAATFLGLIAVDFPSLEQLGWLIGLSMVICGALTLVMVPAALPHRAPRRRPRVLLLPRLAAWVRKSRTPILAGAMLATLVLGYFASALRVNPTLDRLRSVTAGAVAVEQVTRHFALPDEVFVVLQQGADLESLLQANESWVARLARETPMVSVQPASAFLPSADVQSRRRARVRAAVPDPSAVSRSLEVAAEDVGFRPGLFTSFAARLPRMVAAEQSLTWDGFAAHGLQDVIERFVRRSAEGWVVASYAFPRLPSEVEVLRTTTSAIGGMILTGMPIVNEELSARFAPQFLLGLGIGTLTVVVLIFVTFRSLRFTVLALVPTALGLVWAAGLLGAAGVELDLFSVFAVITFVGIGVDYGIHLIHHYREGHDAARAVSELAPVILVAGAITLLGYGTLIGSSYPPLVSIGVVSVVSVITLAVASVLVLPALLQGADS